jgi:hypothetical protein
MIGGRIGRAILELKGFNVDGARNVKRMPQSDAGFCLSQTQSGELIT